MISFFEERYIRQVVRKGCFLLIMDGPHHRRSIEMVKEEGRFSWTDKRFCVLHVMCRNGVSIQHAEAMKLSKVINTLSTIARREKSLVDTMNALENYHGAFGLEYCLKFVDARKKDIVDLLITRNRPITI